MNRSLNKRRAVRFLLNLTEINQQKSAAIFTMINKNPQNHLHHFLRNPR